jgi:hypothetical protein
MDLIVLLREMMQKERKREIKIKNKMLKNIALGMKLRV